MAKTPQPFSLPDEARRSLKRTLSKGVHSARKLTRVRILLKLDEGLGPAKIAQTLGVHSNTVLNVRNRANERGWKHAIEDHARAGRPQEVSAEARAKITALACAAPPAGHSQWSLRLLADKGVELGFVDQISHETVRRILKKTSSSRT